MAHTPHISDAPSDSPQSERLARRWFSLVEHRAFDQLDDLVHPSIVLVSKIRPGLSLEGKEAFLRFVREELSDSLHEAVTTTYRALDDERVVVEGRIRWVDEDRVLRDDPVTWAIGFEDGLLRQFVAVRNQVEAESVLARPGA